ncbi:hypothetical protein Nepgr_031168 [Nepenthes gracilis]|uniref:Flavin-containing monooxygenase n=1 Tax=Nepenthes gracilis TaxID=150966 RepID=A0AAD3Y6J7_NEPGR|nr:hypothetical protein Nepgr_031168 [Nepenthes gracilis]
MEKTQQSFLTGKFTVLPVSQPTTMSLSLSRPPTPSKFTSASFSNLRPEKTQQSFMMGKHKKVVSASSNDDFFSRGRISVDGPVIVGAGPSGLAVASGLKQRGVSFIILERADCVAPLWQNGTYDSLKLNLSKEFCQLPSYPFPENFPDYLSKDQFISYIESYAKHFEIQPQFNESVLSAMYDETSGLWRTKTVSACGESIKRETEYISPWIVVASGANAEKVVPEFSGIHEFGGHIIHASDYKSGHKFGGQRVLVVGCGNSGMDISLDLCDHNATPFMVVRNPEVLRKLESEVEEFKLVPGIKRFSRGTVELVNGEIVEIDSVVLATGYRSNVSSWLKEKEFFSEDGFPKSPFPNGWKGKAGLYAAGFTMLGLYGASKDAIKVAEDIWKIWKEGTGHKKQPTAPAACYRRYVSL